jgi:hypothetical protein
MGARQDGYGDRFEEEFDGYEEEGYFSDGDGGNLGPQGGVVYQQRQQPKHVQELGRQPPVVQQVPQRKPAFQRQIPQQQMQQQHVFQQPPQQFAPQRQMPRQGGVPQRLPIAVPRRHNREVVRGIESHFKPVSTNNPSQVVIPQNVHGRTFEVRTNSLQSLPKYKGLSTEEPYFHLEAYDSICNTIGG